MANSEGNLPRQGERAIRGRARGCLAGLLIGDALGSQVEFADPQAIRRHFPDGLRDMGPSRVWGTLAGQPTDDGEMALALARAMCALGSYHPDEALGAYRAWALSHPFDMGGTVRAGLFGTPNFRSEANGALMRAAPLALPGAGGDFARCEDWAEQDALLTHPAPTCLAANRLYVGLMARAVAGASREALAAHTRAEATAPGFPPRLSACVLASFEAPPEDYLTHAGHALVALQHALWCAWQEQSVEDLLVRTVMEGGDSDTNAAITGALLGAMHGIEAFPSAWLATVLACRPAAGLPDVEQPRPPRYWPGDCLELADVLSGWASEAVGPSVRV